MSSTARASLSRLRGRSYFPVFRRVAIPLVLGGVQVGMVVVLGRNARRAMVVRRLIWFREFGRRFLRRRSMGGLGLGGFL